MCLYSLKSKATKADKDIVCYKVYMTSGDTTRKKLKWKFKLFIPVLYSSPIQVSQYKIRKNTTIIANALYTTTSYYYYPTQEYRVDYGIHTYKCLSDIIADPFYRDWVGRAVVIFKCIIPKGAYYYEGRYGHTPAYCSEKIIIKEIIQCV